MERISQEAHTSLPDHSDTKFARWTPETKVVTSGQAADVDGNPAGEGCRRGVLGGRDIHTQVFRIYSHLSMQYFFFFSSEQQGQDIGSKDKAGIILMSCSHKHSCFP